MITQSPLRRAVFLVSLAVALTLLTSSRTTRAELFPAPDGGYANGNTAEGTDALFSLTTGSFNTANGFAVLSRNTTGIGDTGIGVNALVSNTSGFLNTASGVSVLFNNTTGHENTANGFEALLHNTDGSRNTASGKDELLVNTTGDGNTAEGFAALQNNTGSFNTALGFSAGAALTTGHDDVDIQALGVAGESNTTRIGSVKQTSTFISGIRAVTTARANAVPVVVDSAGQLGTVSSSRRFKEGIEPMAQTSEDILQLKPVTFHYKSDHQNTPQFRLIAEEVAKVNPDLVVRDDKGEIYTVRYDAVNAMLLNEFLKAHRKLEAQQTIIERQQQQIEALVAGLQKVSAEVELNKATATQFADSR